MFIINLSYDRATVSFFHISNIVDFRSIFFSILLEITARKVPPFFAQNIKSCSNRPNACQMELNLMTV